MDLATKALGLVSRSPRKRVCCVNALLLSVDRAAHRYSLTKVLAVHVLSEIHPPITDIGLTMTHKRGRDRQKTAKSGQAKKPKKAVPRAA